MTSHSFLLLLFRISETRTRACAMLRARCLLVIAAVASDEQTFRRVSHACPFILSICPQCCVLSRGFFPLVRTLLAVYLMSPVFTTLMYCSS